VNVAEALSGRTRLDGIRWVLLSAAPRRALRDQLKAMLSAPAMLGPCRLRRAKFKPGRKLDAYYDALVYDESVKGYRLRPIAVTWGEAREAERRHETGLAEIQADAARQGMAAPFSRLMTDLPEWGMRVRVSPLDVRFIQLVRLSDSRYVHDMLAAAYAAADRASDQPRPDRYVVTSIRYRPGQRHVLRYDAVDAARAETVFAKLYTGEDGARVFHRATRAEEWLAQHGEGVTSVRPLAYVAEDGVVLYPGLSGSPLAKHLRRPTAAWDGAWSASGRLSTPCIVSLRRPPARCNVTTSRRRYARSRGRANTCPSSCRRWVPSSTRFWTERRHYTSGSRRSHQHSRTETSNRSTCGSPRAGRR